MHQQTHLRTHTQPKATAAVASNEQLSKTKKKEMSCISIARKHTIRYHILYFNTVKYTLQQHNLLENTMRNWKTVLNLRNNNILIETDAINAKMPY